jgi:hypothetical protein
MAWADSLIVIIIFLFGILLAWSAFEKQKMIDTLEEIKEFIHSLKEAK